MLVHSLRSFAGTYAGLALGAVTLSAAEPAVIAKARARVAPDAVLDQIRSIHYVGKLTGMDPSDPKKTIDASIEIFLQKPAQQRIVVTSPTLIDTSALDDYDAWHRTVERDHPERLHQSQMGAEQIKQLRADVWQNLYFFRGIEKIGGRLEDLGAATIDGTPCEKIGFYHSDSLVYLRYFNRETGELVYTGTAENNIREQGEMMVDGIHFPKTLTISQTTDGVESKRTITFEKITVNEPLPASLFAVPLPTAH
jgi:hypothetical protein